MLTLNDDWNSTRNITNSFATTQVSPYLYFVAIIVVNVYV